MKIFYRPEQTAPQNDSFSPSAGKPAKVVANWLRLDPTAELVRFEPVTLADLALAHDRAYVDAVLDCRIANGFGNKSAVVAATLPYTTGSMVAAAHHAFTTRESCASPTSGFHHASYYDGGGFCTFNGLMVAAQKLRQEFRRIDVGVLDLDAHYGNGTENILWKLSLDYVTHYSFGEKSVRRENAAAWLRDLPEILTAFRACDVVLYQAGADPHVDDPLGGVLTTKQLYERDRIVFTTLKALGVPVAWCLAGGYQSPIEKVLELHDNTARAFMATLACVEAGSLSRCAG
jgi:acetoin utilization deacetylase AcuC-like enzyme